jgi:hypothetical protein
MLQIRENNMRETKVTCDGCGNDLSVRANSVDYRLVLQSESKPGSGDGFYTDMMLYPPVDRAYHFCDLKCLDHWRDHERLYAMLMNERMEAWIEQHGVDPGSFSSSYPLPPDDIRNAWIAESRATATEVFPLKSKDA